MVSAFYCEEKCRALDHFLYPIYIVIQDNQNVLYLFSNKGKLLWRKKLGGKILGDIKQVDLYKNKRLQMAFRTKDRFLILDRNGEIVKPFNIKLEEQWPLHLSKK